MYSYRFAVQNSSKLFEVSSICLDNFLTRVTRELINLRMLLLMLLAALRIAGVVLSCSPCVGLVGEQNVTNHMGLELIQRHNSNRLHMSAGTRCWMRWIWYGYVPSVCNVRQSLRVEVSTSGLNSRGNSESEMPYCIRKHGSDLQRLRSLEQLKCSVSFYPRCSQQNKKLPFMGSW
jgi:hypothetical protein